MNLIPIFGYTTIRLTNGADYKPTYRVSNTVSFDNILSCIPSFSRAEGIDDMLDDVSNAFE